MLMNTNIITPGTGPFVSFFKPSQLPGEYTACAAKYVAHQAKSITGTHLPLGEEKKS